MPHFSSAPSGALTRRTFRAPFTARGKNGAIHLLEFATGKSLLVVEKAGATRVALISGDSRMMTVRRQLQTQEETKFEIRVWNLEGKEVKSKTCAYAIRSLDASPDGLRVALGCDDDRVRILDAETLEETAVFRAHDGPVGAVEFHPFKPLLATGGQDMKVKLWDVNTLEEKRLFIGLVGGVLDVHFNALGTLLGGVKVFL